MHIGEVNLSYIMLADKWGEGSQCLFQCFCVHLILVNEEGEGDVTD
jgi:hypothetical protein